MTDPPAASGAVITERWPRLVVLVAVVLSTVRLLESAPLQSANDRSRWTTVWSLVERGTYQVDEIIRVPGWDTIDKVRHDGHFYSSKPPLLSTIVAGLYWLEMRTLGWRLVPDNLQDTAWATRLLLWFVNILPTWIALECFSRILWRESARVWTRAFVLTAAAFGTLWAAYLPSLNNHTPALCCVVFALASLWTSPGQPLSASRAALAGLFAAGATVFELPAAALLAGLGLWVLLKDRRLALWFAAGAALPIGAHFLTNVLATGDWRPFYAAYGTEKYNYVFEGIPSYWMEPRGVDRARDSFGTYLLHCTIGHHGLLSLSPVWLLALFGAVRSTTGREKLVQASWLGVALTAIVFSFYLSRPAHYNYGGVSVGLRWMLWLIPFWLLLLIPACDRLSGWTPGRAVSALLLALSIVSAWHPFNAPWRQPWLFEWMQARGWIDYRDPAPQFDRPVRSWVFQLPSGPAAHPDDWIELAGTELDGSALTLRVADGGPAEVDGRPARSIDFTWNPGRANERRHQLTLDIQRFEAGEDVADCLLWPDGEPDSSEVAQAVEFLRGLPLPQTYRCAAVRYAKLSLRPDAFRCLIGAAAASRRSSSPHVASVTIRSEIWLCPEVPFGIVLWDTQTTNASTRAPLASRRLTLARAGRILETP
ncbi:MAG: hypothetical protein KF774_16660 [Planctomyces sp.]|nr:hypothetical protein [Planctomyces sp.]